MSDQLNKIEGFLSTMRELFGDVLSKAAAGWSYNQSTGNFLHPLHGAVKIRQDNKAGLQVVHNGKIISSHGEDKPAAMSSATTHMRSLVGKTDSDEVAKDDLDEKIKAKLKAEMDKRNFGEADATKHVIDRDRGAKMPKLPKEPKPLLQCDMTKEEDFRTDTPPVSKKDQKADHGEVDRPMGSRATAATHGEVCKIDSNGQWKIEKSNYGPKGMGLYNQNDNAQRKAKNTGDTVPDAGKNVNVKSYTTTGSSMGAAASAAEAKRQAKANKAAPVKSFATMSPEEKQKMIDQYSVKKEETTSENAGPDTAMNYF